MADLKAVLTKGLKSMKKKNEPKPVPVEACCDSEPDSYPYGLRIDLNKESLKALGLSVGQFNIGESVTLTCKADVITVRATKGRYDESENVELQITDLGFTNVKGKNK